MNVGGRGVVGDDAAVLLLDDEELLRPVRPGDGDLRRVDAQLAPRSATGRDHEQDREARREHIGGAWRVACGGVSQNNSLIGLTL